MTVIKQYIMEAVPGRADDLRRALELLIVTLQSVPGFEGARFLDDGEAPDRVIFWESWVSVQAHEASGARLPKDAFVDILSLLRVKPVSKLLNGSEPHP